MNELRLAGGIAFRQPADLSLSYRMHRLVNLDRSQRAFYRPESEAGSDALLMESVILLDGVVVLFTYGEVPATAAPTQFTALLKFRDSLSVSRMPVHIGDPGRGCTAG
jgi:hypothetical protein